METTVDNTGKVKMGVNDIAKVREQAHDTNVANKIIDSLKGLKQSSDEKSRCRWVWELIQNAKDVVNSTGGIDIRISFNEQQKKYNFHIMVIHLQYKWKIKIFISKVLEVQNHLP